MVIVVLIICYLQNVIIVLTSLLAYAIPDMPRKLKEQVHREAYLTNEIILKTELDITKGAKPEISEGDLRDIRRRVREAFGLQAKKPSKDSLDQIEDSAV
jgi:anoctamin-1